MKYNILFLCFLLIQSITTIVGQNVKTSPKQSRKIDSLQHVLKTATHDSTRFNAYFDLGNEFEGMNPDTAMYFFNFAIQKAKAAKDELNEAKGIYAVGNCYEDKSDYTKALEKYQQSLSILVKYTFSDDKNTKIKAKKLLASDYNCIGIIYYDQSNYSKALDYYFKALKIDEELGNKKYQAAFLGNIGIVYMNEGDYSKALDYYFKALKMDEEIGNKNYQAKILGNIGLAYSDYGDDSKALEYYFKAVKMNEEIGDRQNQAAFLGNIGNAYHNQASKVKAKQKNRQNVSGSDMLFKKALDYYFKALKMDEEIGDKQGQAINLGNIGNVYDEQENHSKALDYYFKALKIDKGIGDKQGQAIRLGNIGDTYIKLKQYTLAEKNVNQSIKIGEELKIIHHLQFAYNSLSELYEKTGHPQQAFEAYKKSIICRDSVMSENNKKASIQKEMQYQFEKKAVIDSVANAKAMQVKNLELKEQKAVSSKQKIVIAFVIAGLLLLAVFAVFVVQRLRITRRQKRIIEKQKKLVDEKNKTLDHQNQEITAQRDEIATQRDVVITQKDQIELQKKEITDSIHYARCIQEAILPDLRITMSDLELNNTHSKIQNYFIMFKPKDIVSGDFYWATEVHEWLIITVADCTGHGVPGAFMSMLGVSFMNEIVRKEEITKANQVLNELRKEIINALQQRGTQGEQKDGMDISLFIINKQTGECQWAGANNPLYILKKFENLKMNQFENEIKPTHQPSVPSRYLSGAIGSYRNNSSTYQFVELKPDKMPISIYERMDSFTNHDFTLEKDDIVYLFSDGFADQFGGENGKKFLYKRFKELLLSNADKPMNEQKKLLEVAITSWIGNHKQTDDITVMGIKIN